jgi:hypothetical protein
VSLPLALLKKQMTSKKMGKGKWEEGGCGIMEEGTHLSLQELIFLFSTCNKILVERREKWVGVKEGYTSLGSGEVERMRLREWKMENSFSLCTKRKE